MPRIHTLPPTPADFNGSAIVVAKYPRIAGPCHDPKWRPLRISKNVVGNGHQICHATASPRSLFENSNVLNGPATRSVSDAPWLGAALHPIGEGESPFVLWSIEGALPRVKTLGPSPAAQDASRQRHASSRTHVTSISEGFCPPDACFRKRPIAQKPLYSEMAATYSLDP